MTLTQTYLIDDKYQWLEPSKMYSVRRHNVLYSVLAKILVVQQKYQKNYGAIQLFFPIML